MKPAGKAEAPRGGEYAQVAVPGPHRELFTYRVPESMDALARPGHRVLIPFGRRQLVGVIFSRRDAAPAHVPEKKIRPLADVLDSRPILDSGAMTLCEWAARYYRAAIGELARLAGPPGAGWASGPEQIRLSIPAEGELVDIASLPGGAREVYYAALEMLGGAGDSGLISVAKLSRKAGRDALHSRLRLLERAGALAIEWERPATGATGREIWKWAALEIPEEEHEALLARAPKQAEVYDELLGRPGSDAAELETPGAQAALKGLLEKGFVTREKEAEIRSPWQRIEALARQEPRHKLTGAQARAVQALEEQIGAEEFSATLLWGVTGSGKTEVYLRAIERVIESGRSALVLVPEIALTPRLAARFVHRFGPTLAVLHSGLSAGERYDEWQRLRSGKARVALGVRSAVFAPLSGLGLIVVDEEHESTYKQEENPAYNARDAAVKRAQLEDAVVLLGSATPSLETIANVEAGRYKRLELPERVGGRPFPRIEVIDLRVRPAKPKPKGGGKEPVPYEQSTLAGEGEAREAMLGDFKEKEKAWEEEKKRPWFLSKPLLAALEENLANKNQAILYLPRRGFASTLLCHDCGFQIECPNCDVRLRVHAQMGQECSRLACHYCGYETSAPAQCSSCGGTHLKPAGLGTQQLEEALVDSFPQARIARLDRDVLGRKGALEKTIENMLAGQIDFLLGTQMVTKGHDFPAVTLVAVVLADLAWAVPDFRAEERGWQQLAQVAGRAGRGERPGKVLLQTFDPQAPQLARVGEQYLWEFADHELAARRLLRYPPLWRLAALKVSDTNPDFAQRAAADLASRLAPIAAELGEEQLRVLGPAPAVLARLRGRHRWQILLKAASAAMLQRVLDRLERGLSRDKNVPRARVSIDVDPYELM